MKKTKKETIDELNIELSTIENLYKSNCVNWTGKTKDTSEYYSEIIANELLRNLKVFDKIPVVSRTSTYCRENHKQIEINLESNRQEEIFAKRIAFLNLAGLGHIKDYQIPLKDSRADKGLGKIDLISYNKSTKSLYLIELKYEGNPETLLRATLESYTYYKTIDKNKLIIDCLKGSNHSDIRIIPTVLVVPKCNPYDELMNMDNEHPKLKALSLALEIKFFTLEIFTDENPL